MTGLSWRLLLKTAMQGDLKQRTDPRMRADPETIKGWLQGEQGPMLAEEDGDE